MTNKSDVVVVGAGVVGCAVAYYLAREGASVTLIEREAIGSGASTHATGSLSLLSNEFSPGLSFEFALSGYRKFPELVQHLEEDTGMDLLFQKRPSLRLALDEEEETLIRDMMEWQNRLVPVEWIDGTAVRQLEPRLTQAVRGAAYEDESSQLDSYRLTLALARSAEQKGTQLQLRRVTGLIVQGSSVTGVRTTDGEVPAGTVVLAAGAWSREFGAELGFQAAVRPMKGERLMLRFPGDPLPVLINSPKRGHMISRLDGLLSVGSTGGRDYDQRELFLGEEFDRQTTEAAKVELLQRAIDVLPALQEAELVQQLAGSRPLSPDGLPLIGPVPGWRGIILATGHGTKGIHLGPITGLTVAQHILGGRDKLPENMSAFLPERFTGVDESDFYNSSLRAGE